jgi:hypothetical protein
MTDILFYGNFIGISGSGLTGLTVDTEISRITKSNATVSKIVTLQNATEVGKGIYSFLVSGADLSLYDYCAVFKTTSLDALSKNVLDVVWNAGEQYDTKIDNVDIAISSVSNISGSSIWQYSTRTLTV